jgi:cytochrome c oxidase subunit 1
LPWQNPMMLVIAFSFVMLGLGGAGGLINMSYQLNSTIHNTQWVTGHFHLIFGGAIVIMYFAIAYELWPQLTGRAIASVKLVRTQLWLWFIGMMVVTLPWHYVGLLGAPRRMAYYDYNAPGMEAQAFWVGMSAVGGLILVASGVLFIYILAKSQFGPEVQQQSFRFASAVQPVEHVPAALNSFGLWVALMIGLTVVNYSVPIVQLLRLPQTSVPAVVVGAQR